uniref:SG122_C3 n=1 Tax=synthetic construct TaxID=32630 RepID=UPI0027403094|nr:Chain A, SG122_C3 [synthetic construct]8E1E_B Chain B, SG122_C3 [synthetic construct]8E1E_C Chain C, SG122_C3 [synthetic construct]
GSENLYFQGSGSEELEKQALVYAVQVLLIALRAILQGDEKLFKLAEWAVELAIKALQNGDERQVQRAILFMQAVILIQIVKEIAEEARKQGDEKLFELARWAIELAEKAIERGDEESVKRAILFMQAVILIQIVKKIAEKAKRQGDDKLFKLAEWAIELAERAIEEGDEEKVKRAILFMEAVILIQLVKEIAKKAKEQGDEELFQRAEEAIKDAEKAIEEGDEEKVKEAIKKMKEVIRIQERK